MSKNNRYISQFKSWLNQISQFSPKLALSINNVLSNLGKVSEINFFESENEPSFWDVKEKTILINLSLSKSQIFEDLILLIYDVNNPNHQLIKYEQFSDGANYAKAKTIAQYESFHAGYLAIIQYLNPISIEEIEKVFEMDQQETSIYLKNLQNCCELSLEEYAEISNSDHFNNEWNNYNWPVIGSTDDMEIDSN